MFNRRVWSAAIVGVALAILASPAFAQQSCEQLAGLKLSYTTIISSIVVADAPARCEVTGIIRPTSDSQIKFAVWLPMAGWNGKYTQLGNGGWAGSTPYRQMIDPCVVVMQRRAPTTVTKAVMAPPGPSGIRRN